ncbi:unnamed protein product [Nyctereutes procyonoides]|uniref:(raccoon dog) hypothetical protein n=1 Tax=Nyctereutes procyonoides TaxID=34880 RepID=A0A811Y0F0_NYCPR|nr:unnamed protein product [Nyctereutes procyonoides]
MARKFNPNEIKVIDLTHTGGEVNATFSLALKIGPLEQAQIEVVPFASALVIKAFREPLRDRKQQKNIKHSGNTTFNEIFNIRTIKEILGAAQSVGCNADGCPPHDITDDINTGVVDYPTSQNYKRRYFNKGSFDNNKNVL